jgi:succinate dehydrogenase / fumarate reductase membrane anchor subunit
LELYGWLFIRISGVLLIFLVLGHLVIMHLLDGGVNRVNFDFVAQRLSTPFWRTYDFALLVLAMGHGVWGMRNVLLDYIHRPVARLVALSLLYAVAGVVLALGAIVLFTFQPR